MKKFSAFILALLLLSTTAFAETFSNMGIKFDYQNDFNNAAGVPFIINNGIAAHTPTAAYMAVVYIAMSQEEVKKLESESAETQQKILNDKTTAIAVVLATNGTLSTALAKLENRIVSEKDFTEFGTAEGFKFYYAPMSDKKFLDKIDAKYKSDIEQVRTKFFENLKKAQLFAPVDPQSALIGKIINFDSVTLDGEKISSTKLFSANKITMLNIWGSWCPPCVMELDELAELHKKFQSKGCGVAAVEFEQFPTESTFNEAREILRKNGVTFPNVLMPDNPGEILANVRVFPTTFFVDKDGKILTQPIIGAAVNQYESAMNELLKKFVSANNVNSFRVYIMDGDKPVNGAVVKFCDENICNIGKTDSEGLAAFDVPAGKIYDVQIIKVPAGYKLDKEIYRTLEVYSDIIINLEKS